MFFFVSEFCALVIRSRPCATRCQLNSAFTCAEATHARGYTKRRVIRWRHVLTCRFVSRRDIHRGRWQLPGRAVRDRKRNHVNERQRRRRWNHQGTRAHSVTALIRTHPNTALPSGVGVPHVTSKITSTCKASERRDDTTPIDFAHHGVQMVVALHV